jgi:transcriptional regulator with XRE-family HTH domain
VSDEANLGPALRSLRRRLDLTLSEVAKKTGITASTLSKTERNRLSLTYDKLVQLCQGLNVDITVFFDARSGGDAGSDWVGRRSINRENDGRIVDTDNYRYIYLSTDLLKKKFLPIICDITARSLEEFGELVRHPGEEFVFVIQGEVALHTEHYAPVILKVGESIYFDSRMAHAYIAHGDGQCRLLSICSAPESALPQGRAAPVGSTASAQMKRSSAARRKQAASKSR